MRKSKRIISALALCLALAFTATACGGGSSSASGAASGAQGSTAGQSGAGASAPAGEQTFVYASSSALPGINPQQNTGAPENEVYDIVLETLVRYVTDENGEAVIKPGVAESWEVSEDGKTYTFHLRDNAMWNDGVPVTAQDFLYTFQTMANPATGSTNAWLFEGIIENFTEALYNDGTDPKNNKKPEEIGVAAPDDKTVVFTLTRPAPFFLELVSSPKPIRQDKMEEWGDAYGSSADKLVTNGAFSIESWTQNIEMVMAKNPNYWDAENVKLEKVVRKVLSDPSTMVQALLSGEINSMATNDPDWQQMILAGGDFKEMPAPTRAPEFLAFNCANQYFKNPKIRLAFSLAFDRQKFVDDLRNGKAVAIETVLPDVFNVGDTTYTELVGGKNEQILADLRAANPDLKALLVEGLKEEGLDPDPAKMEVHFASRGTDELSKKIAEWYYQQFQENLGVNLTIDMMDWNIMWDKIDSGDYDIALSGWGPYYNDPEALLSLFHLDSGYFNKDKTGWSDESAQKYADLLQQAKETTDNKEKAQLYLEAETILLSEAVVSPEYLPVNYYYLSGNVQGIAFNPNSYTDYTQIYMG